MLARSASAFSRTFAVAFGAGVLAVALAAAPRAAGAQGWSLGVRLSVPTAAPSGTVRVADMNGDGFPDLVTANPSGPSVSVLLGDGRGRFAPHADFALSVPPTTLVVADVNGDGRPDVLTTNGSSGRVAVMLGDGAGGLGPATTFPCGSNPVAIVAADLDGDGHVDLVVASADDSLTVLTGNGTGGFGTRRGVTLHAPPFALAIGDLDGDGLPDLVVANGPAGTVSVLLADGHGGYGAPVDLPAGASASGIALADVNGDGRLDLVVADSASHALSVLPGDGAGGFGARTVVAVTGSPTEVAVADVNGDGDADLVSAGSGVLLSVALGDGTGHFAMPSTIASASSPAAIAMGDVDGDGVPDVVCADSGAASLSVLLGRTGPGLGPVSRVSPSSDDTETLHFGSAFTDVNHDGFPDLVLSSIGRSTADLRLGDGNGGFGAVRSFASPPNDAQVVSGDLDGDGAPDLVMLSYSSTTVSVLLGDGAGGFRGHVEYAVGASAWAIALADVNGDGRPDLLAATFSGLHVLLGDGAGGFGAPAAFATDSTGTGLAVGDLDGDGRPDVAMTLYDGVMVLLGDGTGAFTTAATYPTGPLGPSASNVFPVAVAISDLDGDHLPDVVIGSYHHDSPLSVLMGTGAGGLGAPVHPATVGYADAFAIMDVNGDGRPDLVVGSDGDVGVALGDGTGGFGPEAHVALTGGEGEFDFVFAMSVADVNGDGRPDVLSTGDFHGSDAALQAGLERTRTTLATSPAAPIVGTLVTLTATVTVPAPGNAVPAGAVLFFDGTTWLGSSPVLGGVATLAFPASRRGARAYRAVYHGDARTFGSCSAPSLLTVRGPSSPTITGVTDVPGDQGRAVRLAFLPSPLDAAGSNTPVTAYEVYRRPAIGAAPSARARAGRPAGARLDGWDDVATVPATADTAYAVVVPTLADSNATGTHEAVFLVRALTAASTVFFDSAPDSGWSVDNLAPPTPAAFTAMFASGSTYLSWSRDTVPDLAAYQLYRGLTADFVPGPGNLVTSTLDTSFVDAGVKGAWYALVAVDVNGNTSPAALVTPSTTLAVGGGAIAFALERPSNPQAAGSLTVSFALPEASRATLELIDVSGRVVSRRDVGAFGAGRHTVSLSDGVAPPAGVYFVRLAQGARSASARVTLLR